MDPARLREAVDPALAERFGDEVDRLWPREDRFTDKGAPAMLGLAVSGGPDSLAMLLLADAAMPGEIAVASVNHGIRPEAASEVALVQGVCIALGVPFSALSIRLGRGNLQSRAREMRYSALIEWVREALPGASPDQRIGALATAHHADDQAETLLMRLARGSGLSGLAGVRAAHPFDTQDGSDPVPVIRPLLAWRKEELEVILSGAGIVPARDPSNADTQFDRVRVRDHLAEHDWLDPNALALSAQHLAESWRAIEWYSQIDWEEMVHREGDGTGFRYNANVPRVIQIETVRRIVSELGGLVTRGEAGRAADRLWRGQNASLGGVLAMPTVEHVAKMGVELRVWRFTPEPARRTH